MHSVEYLRGGFWKSEPEGDFQMVSGGILLNNIFNKCLLNICYVPATVLVAVDAKVNKTHMFPPS